MGEMRTVHIEVTQEHIDLAMATRNFMPTKHCPVYRALKSVIGNIYCCGLSDAIWHNDAGGELLVRLPDTVKQFINRFDWGYVVQPFSFDIDVPVEYFNMGVRENG